MKRSLDEISLHSSFIAGFLKGDAHFYNGKYPHMVVELIKYDKDILERIRSKLDGIGHINFRDRTNTRNKGIGSKDTYSYQIAIREDYNKLIGFLEKEEQNRDELEYWAGFVCAEGCFHIDLNVNRNCKFAFSVHPSFIVSQKDLDILRQLSEFLGFGKIRKHRGIYELRVRNLDNCLRVAEMFYGFIHNVKYKDFLMWKYILKFIKEKKHLSKKGLLYIAKLRNGMNTSKKIIWTPEKIEEYWKVKGK